MSNSASKLAAETRTEFGKGAARRARRAGKVPAVMYGHGTDPVHITVSARDFAAILRKNGTNAILSLNIEGQEQLALTKQVVVHPLRNYIEHADLLVVKRGETVAVEVTIVVEGEAAPGALATQEATVLQVEADALNIPEQFVVSIEGLEVGTQITAADLELGDGVTLAADPETLIVNVVEPVVETESDADSETADEESTEDEAGDE